MIFTKNNLADYKYIIDPITKKKYNISSNSAMKILKKYLNNYLIQTGNGDPLLIDDITINQLNRNDNIIIIPDNHGKIKFLEFINEIKDKFSEKYTWIAIEYVLNGLEKQLNEYIKELSSEISDNDCLIFCKVFIYGKNTDSSDCSKLYAPDINYTRMLLKTLKRFNYIICLESITRPYPIENYWASLLNNMNSGIILVGAAHVINLSKQIGYTCNTVFRNYRHPSYHFIRNVNYKPLEYEVKPF